ncbi:N-alpha-acetyltransferase 38, NatC auxiliary subunit-like [Anneissia japonica]|uniref:N-alpha-acetyltransferase 38, NatC auxiliary subunit-like n=1 Tax=Anneissia japonica TaxID=1529436 RepID=UPI001425620B|nr:N-alpha-acetyltransferase 38, NatC auxiliary subunit-like [Anneissia japonica]
MQELHPPEIEERGKDASKCAVTELRKKLETWLNRPMKIKISDGRTLVGIFLCTDKDRNVILGTCEEYVGPYDSNNKEEPRTLGLAMIPGRHIVSIEIDDQKQSTFDVGSTA